MANTAQKNEWHIGSFILENFPETQQKEAQHHVNRRDAGLFLITAIFRG